MDSFIGSRHVLEQIHLLTATFTRYKDTIQYCILI